MPPSSRLLSVSPSQWDSFVDAEGVRFSFFLQIRKARHSRQKQHTGGEALELFGDKGYLAPSPCLQRLRVSKQERRQGWRSEHGARSQDEGSEGREWGENREGGGLITLRPESVEGEPVRLGLSRLL